jgi:branched-chain amino acid transport system permease protein
MVFAAVPLSEQLGNALVIGVITGAVYSLLAVGIVLVYKASGVFNFAQGEFGTIAVYLAYVASDKGYWNLPFGIALLFGLAGAVVLGLVTERLVIRPLFDAPRVTLLVATAGVALFAIGLEFWRFNDPAVRSFPAISAESARITVLGIRISDQRILILLTLAAIAVILVAFFRSPLGLAVLAASQEPVASELVGVSVRKISSLTWALAALFGGLAGILQAAPNGGLGSFQPGFLTFGGSGALIPGFTAAVLGGMGSLPGAVGGGILIGVVEALGGLEMFEGLPGARSVMVFGMLLLVLLVRPQGLFVRKASA